MRTIKKMQPGTKGTKKLVDIYGDKLVCVRYRKDDQRNRNVKTIELIIDENAFSTNASEISMNKLLCLDVKEEEALLGRAIRSEGGKWNRKAGVWELPYKKVLALGLEGRIVKSKDSVPNKSGSKKAEKSVQ
jgi:hypothetical protein